MPPKGWRKDSQGNYPTTSYIKEQENITIEDLLFPRSTVVQLAKEIHQQNGKKLVINKDAALALQRSATVFVNHLLLFAREYAKDQDRKSCNVDDVLNALDHIGHGGFKTIVRNKLEDYQYVMELKKQQRKLQTETETDQQEGEQEMPAAEAEPVEEGNSESTEGTSENKKAKTGSPDGTATAEIVVPPSEENSEAQPDIEMDTA
ncbi:hypothetical protein NCAS_0B03750 [Naumovozyma castellii]|uniref:DNA polymerase epsilon subunit D n=1 Tax=Naumovozyma castellii TaxID=27288 RepID=G0VBY2_NAUCA|nr:hypothetical protein NCAS_0B03750 [Naumovozyma castellii CBS 4309]CCC68459.1 hypothetical protein NCAS_0B03750 [Naumovozyma castellii CBS 4309]